MIDPHLATTIEIGTIIRTDIGLAGQDPIPAIIDTEITVEVTHAGIAPGHITDTAAHHATETQAHIAIDKTLHTEDSHHTKVFPGIAVNPDHVCHTNQTAKHHQNHLTAPTRQLGKTNALDKERNCYIQREGKIVVYTNNCD